MSRETYHSQLCIHETRPQSYRGSQARTCGHALGQYASLTLVGPQIAALDNGTARCVLGKRNVTNDL